MAYLKLTPTQQDYLEACFKLAQASAEGGVRVTDIATTLGTRLPTVVRTLARLKALGLLKRETRGLAFLTPLGIKFASQLAHRHADVRRLLTEVLGVPSPLVEHEACLIEHGLSSDSAQRLHEFLGRWDTIESGVRNQLAGSSGRVKTRHFDLVGRASSSKDRRSASHRVE